MNWTVIGIWIGALLTLCIYSFLYKDNPFYKFAEHVYVGISAGYLLAQDFWVQLRPNLFLPLWNDYTQRQVYFGFIPAHWYLFIPGILGLLVFTIFIPKVSWMFRYTLAFTVGVFSGLAITAELSGPGPAPDRIHDPAPAGLPGRALLGLGDVLQLRPGGRGSRHPDLLLLLQRTQGLHRRRGQAGHLVPDGGLRGGLRIHRDGPNFAPDRADAVSPGGLAASDAMKRIQGSEGSRGRGRNGF